MNVRFFPTLLLAVTSAAAQNSILFSTDQTEQTASTSGGTVLQTVRPNEVAYLEFAPCPVISAEKWAPVTCYQTMAGNEEKHGQELRERRQALFGDAPRRVSRAMLWDVEAPEYDETRAFMSARQAMGVALRAETKAQEFFVKALPWITDDEVRRLFEELRDEEVVHQTLVREALRNLPPEPAPDPEDYEDEPVGL